MKVKKIGTVAIIVMFGATSMLWSKESVSIENRVAVEPNSLDIKSTNHSSANVTEDEIMKALSAIKTIEVMKASDPRIVSKSKPNVKKKHRNHVKRKVRRKRRVNKISDVDMENLPMAKSYPMSYDVSQITE